MARSQPKVPPQDKATGQQRSQEAATKRACTRSRCEVRGEWSLPAEAERLVAGVGWVRQQPVSGEARASSKLGSLVGCADGDQVQFDVRCIESWRDVAVKLPRLRAQRGEERGEGQR